VQALSGAMAELNAATDQFGRTVTSAFARGVMSGRSFEDILRSIGQRLVEIALQAALKPAENALDKLAGNVLGSLSSSLGSIKPFADGGIIGSPTLFGMAGGLGLAGEAGAEAVMPLARGPDGKLGVRGQGGGITINVAISTPDVESFRRSEAQLGATLSRAVARGQRSL
jgi:phage-related minor tail protein